MHKCEATLAHAATGLGITPRTLQRRLASANSSFQGVLDATRREPARLGQSGRKSNFAFVG